MTKSSYLAGACLALTTALMAPTASAACDISETKCVVNGGKCNINFRNVTDQESGSGGGTGLNQSSSVQGIKVKALKENGNTAGNTLTIEAGANKTMNIDKKAKKNFAKIRITSPNMVTVEGVTMSCQDVQAVLNGTGTCKIFNGHTPYGDDRVKYNLGFNCDSGNVTGPGR
ncbi:MAG: hypothetical protein AAFQ04_09630 [Pseudomonadota bacterium]